MATDYDEAHSNPEDLGLVNVLPPARNVGQESFLDEDIDTADSFELPGDDLSGEVLQTEVLPQQADEFTCCCCFLVQHKSRLATDIGAQPICVDCA